GRAGWRVQVSARVAEAENFGRREIPRFTMEADGRPADEASRELLTDLFDEAADAVEVVRRLWDSWEDDAIIKDVPTGRFVDRDKLHYIDFDGRFFSVKGPSIVPRPPQGQPVVAALAHRRVPIEFAAASADLVFVTPADTADVPRWIADVRDAETTVGRVGPPLLLFADLVVFLADTTARASARKAHLDDLAGAELVSDAAVFIGSADDLADQLVAWRQLGFDGFRLRPGVIGHDLVRIVDDVVPALQRRGVFREAYEPGSLRLRLGLDRPVSRYAKSA
ncbi:MAG: LLM class flavin-dependent oxidoreductase, partial [Ilumatobacteraceae bacterium]